MKCINALAAVILIAIAANVNAQAKDERKYRKESEDMRKQVWAWTDPAFKVTAIPSEYANASKVVLAQHTELTADSKSKIVFTGLGFGSKKEQTITEIAREMIKINDKNAVTEYSELSFTMFERNSGFLTSDKTTAYIGVRIIKPDGKMEEINADDIILTKNESFYKKAKVAIPDLQPGDVIDYFLATEQLLDNDFTVKPYHVILFSEAPILNLSFHAQLGRKYAIQYRSYNGAPDLDVNKNNDDDIVVDVKKTNIPAFETSLWISAARQLPFIRMNISLAQKRANDLKKGEISKNTNSDEFVKLEESSMSSDYNLHYRVSSNRLQYDGIESDAKKFAKQCNINFKELNDQDKALWLYYSLRFTKLLNFDVNQLDKKINIGDYSYNNLALPLYYTLKAADINPAVILTDYRTGYRMSEIMDADDLALTAFVPGANKFLAIQSVYDLPFTMPADIEGLNNITPLTTDRKDFSVDNSISIIKKGGALPVSTSDQNAHIENIKLSLSDDKNNIEVQRSTILKGYFKTDIQRKLILYEDFYEEERKAFNEQKSLIEALDDGRKSRKYVDEVKNAFTEARKHQKIDFIDEARDWFNQDITDLKNYKTDTLGVRVNAPDFVYSSSFSLNGLVKKAGNNIIIEIGKIEGEPLVIKPEQRKRNMDIYMSYARSIEYNIDFEIPEGYKAEGITSLNKNISNDAGFFTTEAKLNGTHISIKVKKHYLHNFEPAANWDKIIEFTDAAGDWANSKILLKKVS